MATSVGDFHQMLSPLLLQNGLWPIRYMASSECFNLVFPSTQNVISYKEEVGIALPSLYDWCGNFFFFKWAETIAAPPTTSAHLFPTDPENCTGETFQQILDHFLAHLFSLLAAKLFLQFTHSAANALILISQTWCNIIILIQMSGAFKQRTVFHHSVKKEKSHNIYQ